MRDPVFREGDEVVLAEGTYQGTPGVFLRFREDANWADITERSGAVRSHPVAWLAHAPDGTAGPSRVVPVGAPVTPAYWLATPRHNAQSVANNE